MYPLNELVHIEIDPAKLAQVQALFERQQQALEHERATVAQHEGTGAGMVHSGSARSGVGA